MSIVADNPYSLYYTFAQTDDDVCDSLALRRRVFVEQKGASMPPGPAGIETDALDTFCLHLIVRNRDGRAVASTRILTHDAAIAAGRFCSATEFDIERVLARPGRFLEVGRTCVDPGYPRGGAIAALWHGLADLIRADDYDHLIGCASIDLRHSPDRAHAICHDVLARRGTPADQRVTPRRPLPPMSRRATPAPRLPPLLRAYLRLGARIAGPPCHDPESAAAKVFLYLNVARLSPRYGNRQPRPGVDRELRLSA